MTASTSDRSSQVIQAVDNERKNAATKALDISLNELADMYESGELEIRPEYQRLFRWSLAKQSQLIESIILEMPIPQIFVIESDAGKWELIDGLQRLSSYLHFRGKLNAPRLDDPIRPGKSFPLQDCDIVPTLNGLAFDDLPTALQIRLKRWFFRVEIVRKETNPRFRFHMFTRLNTGGEMLSAQEVRNCTIRLLDPKFNSFIQNLSRNDHFGTCTKTLTDNQRKRMGDVELVLRFFAFKNDLDRFVHDVHAFMTAYMEAVAVEEVSFDYGKEKTVFQRTFELLADTLGERTCQRWHDGAYKGQFSMHHFEAFTIGTARVVDSPDSDRSDTIDSVKKALESVKKAPAFQGMTTGGGKNSPGLYREKINCVEEALRSQLQ